MTQATTTFDDGVVFGSIEIHAGAHDVFAVYRDVERWPEWDPDLEHARIDGPFRLGQTGRIKPCSGPRIRTRITEFVDDHAFVATAPLPGCRIRFGHRIEPLGDATSNRVRVEHEVSFDGPLAGFFGQRIAPQILAALPAALEGLKAYVESRSGTRSIPPNKCPSGRDAALPLRDRLHPVHDGRRFHYPGDPILATGTEVLRWAITRRPAKWPRRLDNPVADRIVGRVGEDELRVTMINHATVLLQVAGLNLLTDPVFAQRVSPVRFAGPARHRKPGIAVDALPPIDAILLSHGHYDHLDLDSLTELQARFRPRVLAPLGFAALLERAGIESIELSWWQCEHVFDRIRATAVPARHWTSRSALDANQCLWCGYLLETPAGNVYFAGDTGYGDGRHFREARDVFGRCRLALLPIGAYEPRWFMKPQHMNPEEAVRAWHDLDAAHALAIHFGTFQLTDEAHDAPVRALEAALGDDPQRERFRVLGNGQAWDVPSFPGSVGAGQSGPVAR